MIVSKRIFIRITTVLSIFLMAYFISSLLQSELWGNILSPINAFIAGGILCFSYLKSSTSSKVSIILLLYAGASATWGTADVLWAIIYFSGSSTEQYPIIWIIYAMANIFLLASMLIFAVEQFMRWDLVQYGIDLIISGYMGIEMFWILFLHKDISVLSLLLASDYTCIIAIVSDILILVSIFSWFLSVRSGKIPSFLYIISFGIILFAFTDMFYYYIDLHNLYIPNAMNDFSFIASLSIIAFGALWKTYKSSSTYDISVVMNTGGRLRWIYLLLYPFFTVLISVSGAINARFNVSDFISFAVPIFLYWGSCKYVQVSIEKEALLRRQNEILEQRISEQVKELTFLANRDTLTTLFNRRYFITCLEDNIRSLCQNDLMAVLLIDLDRFKTINDTYGHDIGDNVLIDMSFRMIEWNNCGATVARLGGDEFALMFVGKYTQKDIEEYCAQIIDICSKPINIRGHRFCMTISVGISLASENAGDGKTLMKNADIAMYSAKSQGYNKYQLYNPIMDQDFKQNVKIEALLKQADVENDFKLYYQPQYSLPDLKLIGAEALIRWENREYGFIPPNVFIPIAEEIDNILQIGKWVMKETIRQSKIWNSQYPLQLRVGFNISPKQFEDIGFIKLLETLISAGNLDPQCIDAEITESVMIKDGENVNNIFRMFEKLGISVSIDDFGSRYSALSYLNKYPFNRIKIDKTLIDGISPSSASIVKAAIDMAHAAGIEALAEGVETNEQLEILKGLGCDQVQGYLLGRPVPAEIFEQRFIEKHFKETVA